MNIMLLIWTSLQPTPYTKLSVQNLHFIQLPQFTMLKVNNENILFVANIYIEIIFYDYYRFYLKV